MTSPIDQLLKKYHVSPKKSLGQNFLIDRQVLQQIIQASQISENETVLEIGPGLGVLTEELIKKSKNVIAVEKDKRFAEILKERFAENADIIEADILKVKNLNLKDYLIVANLPYYIVSPVIRLFLELANPPQRMILLVQKEVAQRICAKTGKMSILSVSVQLYGSPQIIDYVAKESFWPIPKVDSAILKIDQIEKPIEDTAKFFKIVKAGFISPRKVLVNNLSRGLDIEKDKIRQILSKLKISEKIRAQGLSISEWQKLTKLL